MEDTVRKVAWAIAEVWWRRNRRQAAGALPEANSSTDYADHFWQSWVEEAKAAIVAAGIPATSPMEPERSTSSSLRS